MSLYYWTEATVKWPNFPQGYIFRYWFFISTYGGSYLLTNCFTDLFTSLVYPFSVGDWPIVIFLRKRSLVSNTKSKHNEHMSIDRSIDR